MLFFSKSFFVFKAPVDFSPLANDIYLPHESPYQAHAIDCWRLFEVHWLGLKGQPQSAALQALLYQQPYKINSFALKALLLNFNQHQFINVNNLIAFLSQHAQNIGVEPQWSTFLPSLGKPELSSLAGYFYHTHTARFICEQSGQPMTGEVQLLLSHKALEDIDTLHWLLLDRRSLAFNPVSYVDSLFSSILSWGQPFVLSVHLARRGGISYQGLRWHEQKFLDPVSLMQLSALE